jgi:hypothetical protein
LEEGEGREDGERENRRRRRAEEKRTRLTDQKRSNSSPVERAGSEKDGRMKKKRRNPILQCETKYEEQRARDK